MVKTLFKNVKIKGISTIIPPKEVSILDNPNLYNGDQKKIKRVINSSGFLNRRVTEKDVMTSDLCFEAAEDLIKNLNIDKSDIDALLFMSYTPDYLMPATSYILHKRLNLSNNCICMDIPQACSGYEIGLYQASMLINSGCKKVLLLVGDCFSKFTDMFNNNTAPVFGDAGSATLIEYDENAENSYFSINSDGSNWDALACLNGGFRNYPNKADFYESGEYKYNSGMDGGRIFEFTMNKISPSIEELFEYSNINKSDIDYFVMHQANKFILQNIARQLDIDISKVPMETISKYGNQCGASIPCTISDVLKESISNKKNKLLLSGFGVGLSWANAIITTDNIYCSGIKVYEGEK